MADRALGIFAQVFKYLAAGDEPEPRAKHFARQIWENCRAYGISPYHLECNDQLIKLGLAQCQSNQVIYRGDDRFVEG